MTMTKKIIINVRPIISNLLADWDGEGKQSQYIRRNKKLILEFVENLVNDISVPYDLQYINSYKLDIENREVIITYTWIEQDNIYDWCEGMKLNLQVISDHIWQKGLTCIVK